MPFLTVQKRNTISGTFWPMNLKCATEINLVTHFLWLSSKHVLQEHANRIHKSGDIGKKTKKNSDDANCKMEILLLFVAKQNFVIFEKENRRSVAWAVHLKNDVLHFPYCDSLHALNVWSVVETHKKQQQYIAIIEHNAHSQILAKNSTIVLCHNFACVHFQIWQHFHWHSAVSFSMEMFSTIVWTMQVKNMPSNLKVFFACIICIICQMQSQTFKTGLTGTLCTTMQLTISQQCLNFVLNCLLCCAMHLWLKIFPLNPKYNRHMHEIWGHHSMRHIFGKVLAWVIIMKKFYMAKIAQKSHFAFPMLQQCLSKNFCAENSMLRHLHRIPLTQPSTVSFQVWRWVLPIFHMCKTVQMLVWPSCLNENSEAQVDFGFETFSHSLRMFHKQFWHEVKWVVKAKRRQSMCQVSSFCTKCAGAFQISLGQMKHVCWAATDASLAVCKNCALTFLFGFFFLPFSLWAVASCKSVQKILWLQSWDWQCSVWITVVVLLCCTSNHFSSLDQAVWAVKSSQSCFADFGSFAAVLCFGMCPWDFSSAEKCFGWCSHEKICFAMPDGAFSCLSFQTIVLWRWFQWLELTGACHTVWTKQTKEPQGQLLVVHIKRHVTTTLLERG